MERLLWWIKWRDNISAWLYAIVFQAYTSVQAITYSGSKYIHKVGRRIATTLVSTSRHKRKARTKHSLKKGCNRPYKLRHVPIHNRRMMCIALFVAVNDRQRVEYAKSKYKHHLDSIRSIIDINQQADEQRPNAWVHLIQNKRDGTDTSSIAYDTQSKGNDINMFDTDSVPIKVDNCCTRTMSPYITDFVGVMTPVSGKYVQGISGTSSAILNQGTIRWKITDDDGATRTILIPNSYHVPMVRTRLLSPQHWAQQSKDDKPKQKGTWCATYAENVVLHWNQGKYQKTIKLDKNGSNVATMWTTPDYTKYHAFVATAGSDYEHDLVCYDAESTAAGKDTQQREEENDPDFDTTQFCHPLLDGPDDQNTTTDKEIDQTSGDAAALLIWHQRLSHISMKRLQMMAKRGQIPSRLATCRIPICQSCLFGKATRKAWRTRPSTKNDNSDLHSVTKPGECVSVDQLESSAPGLVAQMKGKLTKERYTVATVYVDHFSDLSFVYLQRGTSAKETLDGKQEFERFARSNGVSILHYRADNGRFAENAWKDDVISKGQRLSFCGVSAHHQNGKAEKRIRDIQDLARTSLIHANQRWPSAITANLWPYALRKANESLNKSVHPKHGCTPLERFTRTRVLPNITEDHPFGCPAYALDSNLQNQKKISKWESRARMAVYLGPSPHHAQSVGLLLSLRTGLVSPQFHVRYDDSFETVRDKKSSMLPVSDWQHKCGFTQSPHDVIAAPISEDVISDVINIPDTEHLEVWGEAIDNGEQKSDGDQMELSASTPVQDARPPRDENPRTRTTRSGRMTKTPKKFDDYIAYETTPFDSSHEAVTSFVDPVAYAASSDPDVMYLHEAMKQPDREEFVRAMSKEIKSHTENENWIIMERAKVPQDQDILPAIWAMRRKRRIDTQEVYKWKARINIHGGKQTKGVNYWDTYAPVATWASIRLVLNMAAINGWETRQLDFVLAYPQAPVETDLYMEIPAGFSVKGGDKKYVLKLVQNLYGQKQAGRVWFKYLSDGLCTKLKFVQSVHDPCIFWRGQSVIVVYTDDTIITGPDAAELDQIIKDIASEFDITSEPRMSDFLGVKISREEDSKSVTRTQPQLIRSIVSDLGLQQNSTTRDTPALTSRILQKYDESPPHDENWNYRAVIGKLNYLEKSTRPYIAYAVHQCARFSADPKVEHTRAVKLIGRYLLATADKGIVCTPTKDSFQLYSDADFSGNWSTTYAEHDASTARSRSGYVVKYGGCPIVWASRLQTEIALSSTESEYVALSQGLREVLPLMELTKELSKAGFAFSPMVPQVFCQAFEDNSGALEMARTHKMRPRTKHMNIKYHHFREAVAQGLVTIHAISTTDQLADIFTKPLGVELFQKFRLGIMGW
jgi:Reverse transcriptase (RNA-dependent DNA polymerase)/GAG-pre-integrase domain